MTRPWMATLLAGLLAMSAGLVSGLMLSALARRGAISLALIYFLPLPLLIAGLSLGALAAGVAAVAGGAVVLLLTDGWRALWFLAVLGAPVCWLTRQALLWRDTPAPDGTTLREWYPPGLLLGWLTALASALVAVAFLLSADEEGGLKGWLLRQIEQLIGAMTSGMAGAGLHDREFLQDRVAFAAAALPAVYAVTWMLLMLANASLAQWGVRRMGRAIRPTPLWAELRLPPPLLLGLAAALPLALAPEGFGHFGQTLIPILALPYLFAGLVALHALSRDWHGRRLLLGLTYAGLAAAYLTIMVGLLPTLLFAVPLAALGLIDQWLDLRGRFGRRTV